MNLGYNKDLYLTAGNVNMQREIVAPFLQPAARARAAGS